MLKLHLALRVSTSQLTDCPSSGQNHDFLLSAIPRSLQPCDLSLVERRRVARRWPCSEPRRAYEPARLYQRSTRNAAAAPAQQAMFPRGSTEQSRGAPPILFAETLL